MSRGGQSDARSQAQHERKFAGYRYVYCESRQILECELRLCGMPLGLVLRLLPANDPFLWLPKITTFMCFWKKNHVLPPPTLRATLRAAGLGNIQAENEVTPDDHT